ncbi:MAG: YidC/Oxa1 family membrane protein insertase, partial [Cellulosimicrobium funkei]
LEGPMASTQKMMLYVFPFIFAVSGVNFPVGVLVYWTTTNLWSMGQQFYTIRRMPAPGSEAERLLKERQARKRAAKGVVEDATPVIEQPRGQRQQPKRKDRQKSAPRPVGTVSATTPEDAPVEDAPADKPAPGGAAKGGSGTGASKPAPKKKKQK